MSRLSAEEICFLVNNRIKEKFPQAAVTYGNSINGRLDDDGNFFIIVSNRFIATRFEGKFRSIVEEVLSQFCDISTFAIEIEAVCETAGLIEVQNSESSDVKKVNVVEAVKQLQSVVTGSASPAVDMNIESPGLIVPNIGLNPKYTMPSFIVGDSNKFAHAVSLAVINSPGEAYNPLFFYGGVGLGKTHLMQAIGHRLAENSRSSGRLVAYRTSEVFCNEYIVALKKNSMEAFRKKYRQVEALLIDDVQFFCGKDATLEEFHHTFNELFQSNRQIIMTSDKKPSELQEMPERLISRFKSGIETEITKPVLETRIAILKKLSSDYGVSPNYDCLECIAKKVTTNIRELEGAFTKVVAMASVMNRSFSVSMVEEVLAGYEQQRRPKVITLKSVKEAVCKHFLITMEELVGMRRPKKLVLPRQIAMYLSCDLTDNTLQAIGESFGGRDHTTIVHGRDKIEKIVKASAPAAEDIKVLRIKLKEMIEN